MRPARIPRILSCVSAQSVHVAIDVVVAGDEIRGQICEGAGEPKPFSGWLGLIGALDGLLGTRPPSESGGVGTSDDIDLD